MCTGNCGCAPITSTKGDKGDTGATGATGATGSAGNGFPTGVTLYEGTITQTSTLDPVPTVLLNTLSGPIAWTRGSAGTYTGTLVDGFPNPARTVLAVGTIDTLGTAHITSPTVNTILLRTYNDAGSLTDALLSNTSISIRVYP